MRSLDCWLRGRGLECHVAQRQLGRRKHGFPQRVARCSTHFYRPRHLPSGGTRLRFAVQHHRATHLYRGRSGGRWSASPANRSERHLLGGAKGRAASSNVSTLRSNLPHPLGRRFRHFVVRFVVPACGPPLFWFWSLPWLGDHRRHCVFGSGQSSFPHPLCNAFVCRPSGCSGRCLCTASRGARARSGDWRHPIHLVPFWI